MVTINFGEHLTIDGYGGSPDKLNNKELVLTCLSELPRILGMNILGQPSIYEVPPISAKDPGGWSGFVVISESHISVHTFPGRRFISIDVYTCRNNMDIQFIQDYFKKKFDLEELETNFIKRSTRYPKENVE